MGEQGQRTLATHEHEELAKAKRVLGLLLSDTSGNYIQPPYMPVSTTYANFTVSVTAGGTQIMPSRDGRLSWIVDYQRTGVIKAYVDFNGAATEANGLELEPGESKGQHGPGCWTGSIWAASATGTVTLTGKEFWNPS